MDTGCNIPWRESEPTSLGSIRTREHGKPTEEAEQMTAEQAPAGAASHAQRDWHAINWRAVHKNVRRLQARIVQATNETASCPGRWIGLSRMMGNYLVRFLGGGEGATLPCYPAQHGAVRVK
jgi:N-terminal domain of reverse transcriptase